MMDIIDMQDNTLKSQAFKLKGRLYTFTVLQLLQTDQSLFEKNLDEVIAKAPKMFDNTPVVLDCSLVQNDNLELQTLCQAMRTRGLLPVAVQSANAFVSTIAKTNGMAVLHASSNHDKSLIEDLAEEPQIIESAKNKMLTTPVRSGQQVVVKGGDLIIIASVSHGAELLADGNIHVYGALRGRALAGMSGDKQARIFCHSLEAELLSIAGYYRLSEAFEQQAGPCQIFLQDEHIHIEPLC